jgi:hypothetical protein
VKKDDWRREAIFANVPGVRDARAMKLNPTTVNFFVGLACAAAAYAIVVLTLQLHTCW